MNTTHMNLTDDIRKIGNIFDEMLAAEIRLMNEGKSINPKFIDDRVASMEFAVVGFGGLNAHIKIQSTEMWRTAPASDKQYEFLRKLGINIRGISKGTASRLIDENK